MFVPVLNRFRSRKIGGVKSSMLLWPLLFAAVAVGAIVFIKAATATSSFEAENATLSNGAQSVSDTAASGSSAVKFMATVAPPVTTTITAIGQLQPAAEGSGLVASRQYPGVFWWIRDGGDATTDKPREAVWAVKFDAAGNVVNVRGTDKFPFNMVTGSTNNNWEDIGMDDQNNLWIGDIGANVCTRLNQKLLKIKEPNPATTETVAITASYSFEFPDPISGCNTWNSEAMFWLDGKMYIFAKTDNSPVYRIDLPAGTSGRATLVRLGTLTGGVDAISVSSISDDRKRLMVAGYGNMKVFTTTNTSLTGDALVKDLISRKPTYIAKLTTGVDGLVAATEGGSFVRNSHDVAFVSENKFVYYAKPNEYGDGGQ